jgi:hypothetical protein
MWAVNRVRTTPAAALRRLQCCARIAPTWLQTCWFATRHNAHHANDASSEVDYLAWVAAAAPFIQGVHLYGLARSPRPEIGEILVRLPAEALMRLGEKITKKTGIKVVISP